MWLSVSYLKSLKLLFPKFQSILMLSAFPAMKFQKDKAYSKKIFVQKDYTMNYQCKWQDEVQSALWHRCIIMDKIYMTNKYETSSSFNVK